MLLELKDVSKDFKIDKKNKTNALNKINLSFNKGEFVSIVGPSGSGKSTLLNIIAGLDFPSSGALVIDNNSSAKFKKRNWDLYRKNNVGFIFQNFNLIEHLTALENVEMVMNLIGISFLKRRKRAKELLKKVGLEKYINHIPDELSGGQKQRVAIARALANDPDIILADEPTGALDSKTGIQIINLIKEISKDKLVIMVTHNIKLAEEYSTRIIQIKDGKIEKDQVKVQVAEVDKKTILNKKDRSMSFFEAFKLSLKNMHKKLGRVAITTIAGCIGIIGFCLVLGLGNGANIYLDKQLIKFGNANVVTLNKIQNDDDKKSVVKTTFQDYDDILNKDYIKQNIASKRFHLNLTNAKLLTDDEVTKLMSSNSNLNSNTTSQDYMSTTYFNALAPYQNLDFVKENITGKLPEKNTNQILVNQAAARLILKKLSIDSDDINQIIGKSVNINVYLNETKSFVITGIVSEIDIGLVNIYYDYDYMISWLKSIQIAGQNYFDKLQENYSYDLILKDPNMAKAISDYISKPENGGTGSTTNFMVTSNKKEGYVAINLSIILKNIFAQAILISQIVITAFILISLVVSCIMTAIVLYSSVLERKKEIGIIKAVGGRNKDVIRIFESEAILMGLFSGILGVVLSFVLSPVLENAICKVLNLKLPGIVTIPVSTVPFTNINFPFATVICVVLFSCLISAISGYLPSKKATKMHVIDALRDE